MVRASWVTAAPLRQARRRAFPDEQRPPGGADIGVIFGRAAEVMLAKLSLGCQSRRDGLGQRNRYAGGVACQEICSESK